MKKWYKLPTSLICSVFLNMTTTTIVNAQETTTTEPAYSANLEATSKSTALLSDEEILQKLAEQGMDPNEPGFNKNMVDNHDDSYRGVDPSTESEENTLSPARKKRAIADDCQTYGGAIALPGFPQYTLCGEIKDKYNSVGGQQSFLLAPKSGMILNPDGVGMRAEFVNGFIYWHPETGAHIVSTHFSTAWQAHGWESGVLGYPTSDEYDVPRFGRKQEFQHGHIYGSFTGVYAIGGAIYDKWVEYAAESGMGFPVTNMTFAPDGIGRFQTLERGTIYWHPQFGAHPLWGEIWVNWAAQGFEKGLGYPTSDPVNVDERLTQTFERGQLGMYSDTVRELFRRGEVLQSEQDEVYDSFIRWHKENGVKNLSEVFKSDLDAFIENYNWANTQSTNENIRTKRSLGVDDNCDTKDLFFPDSSNLQVGDIIISKTSDLHINHGHITIYAKVGQYDTSENKRFEILCDVTTETKNLNNTGTIRLVNTRTEESRKNRAYRNLHAYRLKPEYKLTKQDKRDLVKLLEKIYIESQSDSNGNSAIYELPVTENWTLNNNHHNWSSFV